MSVFFEILDFIFCFLEIFEMFEGLFVLGTERYSEIVIVLL